MTRRDTYYNKAKQEGYRARSAYKLKQLDEIADLFSTGDTVIDLGAAPGGWLQVASESVGPSGRVVGVDRQRIDPLDDPTVTTVRGDMTDEQTRVRLRDVLDSGPDERPADVVLSDMAPNMSGEYELDHARSIHLARQAFETAIALLAPGGDLVVKVFDGPELDGFRADLDDKFEYVRATTPDASRDESSERYLIAKRRIDAPVTPGEELEVTIIGMGDEGDGVARVEGFTLFVPGTTEGETLRVRIDDVKPRFAFAERIE